MNKWYKVFGSVIPLLVSILYLFVVILISFLLCPGIRKRSKVPGVMITQFMEDLPEGMSTPDFTRKPIALTIQEGKYGAFKAIVTGTPAPTVTWSRANGDIFFHPEVCLQKYNESSHEHTLEFPKVNPEDADTYKCYATNKYGKAVCTVVLNVINVGFSTTKELQRMQGKGEALKKEKQMEPEEKVWELLLSADKRDYERICAEYGITDFRGMLKKLNEMRREREEQIAEFVSQISTLKHIEVSNDDCATIELDMDLRDPNSKIYLYKNGVMVPFSIEDSESMKHNLKQVGKKYIFTIKNLGLEDAGLYSVDVEGVNVFSTDFKVPEVDFAVKIQEVKAEEREDALFQCVLTAPMTEVKWFGKNAPLSNSDKHEIIVSEDKLIHKLIIRDCLPLDAGIYATVAGIKSCNAWLVVEADRDTANKGRKAAQKFTVKVAEAKSCDLQCPPKFLVPLKLHTAPEGYECYMSCAVKGDPTPHVTWLRNNISLNTNTNYYISNTYGVCSMLILRVGSKDTGEYKVVAENSMGRAECSTKLTVRGTCTMYRQVLHCG
uniref:Immunoglobulin like and fibronectin type III domain containing 1, tandem duplicate 1 n=1 Tax=Cynoglossus semilaevis TaxID=244447 RepID=A0A3P8WFL3_CYNSE